MNTGAGVEKGQQIRRRVVRNTVSNYIGKVITLGAGFLLTPFLLRELGATTYGLWVLVGSVVAYGSLLDFGIAGAVTKYIAEYQAKGQLAQAQRLVSTALALYSFLGLAAIGLSATIAPFFPRWFNIPPGQQAQATWLVVLSGLALGISIPAATTTAILRGLQRFDLTTLIGIAGTLLSVATTVIILLSGGGLLGIVAAGIVITLIMQVPSIWLIRHLAPGLKLTWRAASRQFVRTVASFSLSVFVIDVAGQLQKETDEIVIGLFLPISAITPYALSQRLSGVAPVLTDQFMKVLPPLASELEAENDHSRLRSLYIVSTRLSLASLVPLACIVIILAGPILTVWVGPDYAGYTDLVLILTLAGLVDTSQWPAGHVLQGMARHRPLAVISIASGLANLLLSLILVQKVGIIGVALGTLVPTSIECLALVMPYAMNVIGISAREAVSEIWLPTLMPAIPAALLLYLLKAAFQPSSWAVLAAIAAAGLLVYVGGYLSLGATAIERETYTRLALNTIRLARARLKPL